VPNGPEVGKQIKTRSRSIDLYGLHMRVFDLTQVGQVPIEFHIVHDVKFIWLACFSTMPQ